MALAYGGRRVGFGVADEAIQYSTPLPPE